MRMYHPDLPFTAAKGHETTEKAFELAWQPKGWKVWEPKKKGGPIKSGRKSETFAVGDE